MCCRERYGSLYVLVRLGVDHHIGGGLDVPSAQTNEVVVTAAHRVKSALKPARLHLSGRKGVFDRLHDLGRKLHVWQGGLVEIDRRRIR